jgi:hypothetical protein
MTFHSVDNRWLFDNPSFVAYVLAKGSYRLYEGEI